MSVVSGDNEFEQIKKRREGGERRREKRALFTPQKQTILKQLQCIYERHPMVIALRQFINYLFAHTLDQAEISSTVLIVVLRAGTISGVPFFLLSA